MPWMRRWRIEVATTGFDPASMSATHFRSLPEGIFHLRADDREGVARYLQRIGFLRSGELVLTCSKAGDGNMNCVARVLTSARSVIVKQSRPWVEKYPQFDAPWDRACRELDFYTLIQPFPAVASRMPQLLHGDRRARVLVLEDLGLDGDYTGLYRGEQLEDLEIDAVAEYLSALHGAFATDRERPELANREMRALNHAHIFDIPFRESNGLDLDRLQSGLGAVALPFKTDARLVSEVRRLGDDVYLVDGPCLLHGDPFPGSLVSTSGGLRVIDPEFAFFGHPEFDVGVWLAHLILADQSEAAMRRWLDRYVAPAGFDLAVAWQMAGVEILRRLIGYAQLPLDRSVASKALLLERARNLVLQQSR